MSVFKRLMGVLLGAVLLVGLATPGKALATETEEAVRSLTMETEMQVIDLEEFSEDNLYTDYNPGLASGNHVRWIDRLTNLPAYAMDFYNWFGENCDNDGVDDTMIDVSTAAFIDEDGWCLQPLTTVSGSVPFAAAADADDATLWAAADAALADAFTVEKEKVCGVIYAVTDACDRDYPHVFWRSYEEFVVEFYGAELVYEGSGWVAYYELDYYYALQADQMDVRAQQYQDVSYLRSVIAQRDNAVEQIIAGMPADGTRAETVAYFNDWLTLHNCYNTSADLNNIPNDCRTCISALTGRVGTEGPVCEGYAEAMKVLCDRVGIPCVLVDGAEHMWNYIQMEDGNWYAVDTTWNDPSVDGVSSAVSGYESRDYLLVGGSTVIDGYAFLSDHPVENSASEGGVYFTNGPVLSDTAYVFGAEPDPEPTPDPVYASVTGSWTTDLLFAAADLGVSAPDSVIRATLTFNEDGTASTSWEAVDLTALRMYFHQMFVNAYYAMAYGAGITDINEIEQFCINASGMGVSAYMDTIVTQEAIARAFTPAATSGLYMYNEDHSAIYTDMPIMDVGSNADIANSFVIGGNTMYLNAASYGKPDYTFVCTRVG